jgi:hypothetical protein
VGLVFGALVGTSFLLQLPRNYSWEDFACGDPGSCLQADRIVAEGVRPVADFPYPYGLLPLAVGRGWFWVFGRTPASYLAAVLVCDGLIVWGLARIVVTLRVGRVGLAVMALALPHVVMASYPNLTHALETALLCHALAEQAAGRRGRALALLTVCAFVKPGLAYVYGLVLVLWTGWYLVRGDGAARRDLWRVPLAAVTTGVVVGSVLLAIFGWEALLGTVFPRAALRNYAAEKYGFFFGIGRNFWLPPGATWRYYVGSGAGLWLAASVVLLAAGVGAAWREYRRPRVAPLDLEGEFVLTAALLHTAFVTLLFAHAWCAYYYAFVLYVSLAVIIDRQSWTTPPRRLGLVLVLFMALLSHTTNARGIISTARECSRDPRAAGLWVARGEGEELDVIRASMRGARAFFLIGRGAPDLLIPDVRVPRYWMLAPGFETPYTIEEVRSGLAQAEVVIVSLGENQHNLAEWPEFEADLRRFEVSWEGRHYRLLRARSP